MTDEKPNPISWSKVLMLCLALVLQACGGGGGDTQPSSAQPGNTSSINGPVPSTTTTVAVAPTVTAVDARIQSLPSSTISFGTAADGSKRSLVSSGQIQLAAQAQNSAREWILTSTDSQLRVNSLPNGGPVTLTDKASGLTIVRESTPRGNVIRIFNAAGQFQRGLYIENLTTGGKKLWQLVKDGSTEPANLTKPVNFTRTDPVPDVVKEQRDSPSAVTDSCHSFMSDLTSDPADVAAEVGDALEQAGESTPAAGRVSRAAQFLSSLWRRIPSLCADAPQPVSDSQFQKETALEALRAVSSGKIADLLDQYASYKDWIKDKADKAAALRSVIAALPDAVRSTVGTSSRSETAYQQAPYSASVQTQAQQTVAISAPSKMYVGGSLSCLNLSSGAGGSLNFRSSCTVASTVSWCFSTGPACRTTNATQLAAGASYVTTFPSGRNNVWYAACPALVDGRQVTLSEESDATFYCYYWSR